MLIKFVPATVKLERITVTDPSVSATYTTTISVNDKVLKHFRHYLCDNQKSLEKAKIINWCSTVVPLYSLKTVGKGNCLLNACMMGMIGIGDTNFILRNHLSKYIELNESALHDRWKYSKIVNDRKLNLNLELEEHILEEGLTRTPRQHIIEEVPVLNDEKCVYLQSCHIFAAYNTLKRPIIVVGSEYIGTIHEKQAQLNDIIGLYLPLLTNTSNIIHYPIVLQYSLNHFSPLVCQRNDPSTSSKSFLLPLLPLSFWSSAKKANASSVTLKDLPIHYLNNMEAININSLLKKYLIIEELNINDEQTIRSCLVGDERIPADVNFTDKYPQYLKENINNETPSDNLLRSNNPVNTFQFVLCVVLCIQVS
ncbi:unnamed protein product [Didymodactylos carnosus]|uniref:OTU domain-containing protein n=1 Tax=Didymodactylos carnosus TaxID=1234261 RepID=A0A815P202_9BILA|nr:unnamed protein product [Didymodactylos carnosus]CAF4318594.1 unnamed protein product [Didymodactylos carnosus]